MGRSYFFPCPHYHRLWTLCVLVSYKFTTLLGNDGHQPQGTHYKLWRTRDENNHSPIRLVTNDLSIPHANSGAYLSITVFFIAHLTLAVIHFGVKAIPRQSFTITAIAWAFRLLVVRELSFLWKFYLHLAFSFLRVSCINWRASREFSTIDRIDIMPMCKREFSQQFSQNNTQINFIDVDLFFSPPSFVANHNRLYSLWGVSLLVEISGRRGSMVDLIPNPY